jgi:predicted metal-dependent phosphoesterase TrpH
MHVHSIYSGLCTTPFVRHFCRESYSDPQEVYSLLRCRGMSLFTLTDHDSIEGAERLRRNPDFFVSEELTCRMPSGTEVHIGVYDVNELHHVQLQQRRSDLVALLMYLTERRLFFSINHVLSSLTGARVREDFEWFQNFFPAMETQNSLMLARHNSSAAQLAKQWQKIAVGGSDAHALPSVGMAYTEVPRARNKEEFFAGLRSGTGRAVGESGGYAKLTRDVLLIGFEMMREKCWTRVLASLAVFVPAITFWNYCEEYAFGRHWAAQILDPPKSRKRPRWMSVPQHAAEEWI